jgi:uncharacterized protein (TIGR00251 family)
MSLTSPDPLAAPFSAAADGLRLAVRLTPGAGADRILGLQADASGAQALKVTVTAPAEGGKANRALIVLLARAWRLPKTSIDVVAGAHDRRKTLRITGDAQALALRLAPLVDGVGASRQQQAC